jgi:hypothetical protein
LYNKLSSNNINNNNNVSVIQVCISELTAQGPILYNAYVAVLILQVLMLIQFSLLISSSLLSTLTFSDKVIIALSDVNILFVQQCITSNQIRTHHLLYINVILI